MVLPCFSDTFCCELGILTRTRRIKGIFFFFLILIRSIQKIIILLKLSDLNYMLEDDYPIFSNKINCSIILYLQNKIFHYFFF